MFVVLEERRINLASIVPFSFFADFYCLASSGPESAAAQSPAHAHPTAGGAAEKGEGEQEEEKATAEPEDQPEAEGPHPPPPPPAVPPPICVPPPSPSPQLPGAQGAPSPDRTRLPPPQVQPEEALRWRRAVAGETEHRAELRLCRSKCREFKYILRNKSKKRSPD